MAMPSIGNSNRKGIEKLEVAVPPVENVSIISTTSAAGSSTVNDHSIDRKRSAANMTNGVSSASANNHLSIFS